MDTLHKADDDDDNDNNSNNNITLCRNRKRNYAIGRYVFTCVPDFLLVLLSQIIRLSVRCLVQEGKKLVIQTKGCPLTLVR